MPLLNSGAALFAGGVEEFVRMAPASSLTAHLHQAFNERWGRVGQSEVDSRRHSLTALAHVAQTAGLQRVGVGPPCPWPETHRLPRVLLHSAATREFAFTHICGLRLHDV